MFREITMTLVLAAASTCGILIGTSVEREVDTLSTAHNNSVTRSQKSDRLSFHRVNQVVARAGKADPLHRVTPRYDPIHVAVSRYPSDASGPVSRADAARDRALLPADRRRQAVNRIDKSNRGDTLAPLQAAAVYKGDFVRVTVAALEPAKVRIRDTDVRRPRPLNGRKRQRLREAPRTARVLVSPTAGATRPSGILRKRGDTRRRYNAYAFWRDNSNALNWK